jgi:hypothetical protein
MTEIFYMHMLYVCAEVLDRSAPAFHRKAVRMVQIPQRTDTVAADLVEKGALPFGSAYYAVGLNKSVDSLFLSVGDKGVYGFKYGVIVGPRRPSARPSDRPVCVYTGSQFCGEVNILHYLAASIFRRSLYLSVQVRGMAGYFKMQFLQRGDCLRSSLSRNGRAFTA